MVPRLLFRYSLLSMGRSQSMVQELGSPPPDALTIAPALVQPTSRGSVSLASSNFKDAAVVDGNYLVTDEDLAAIVKAIESEREPGLRPAGEVRTRPEEAPLRSPDPSHLSQQRQRHLLLQRRLRPHAAADPFSFRALRFGLQPRAPSSLAEGAFEAHVFEGWVNINLDFGLHTGILW